MLCFSLLFTRPNKTSRDDDKIEVISYEDSRDVFEVKYHTPELKNARRFLGSFSNVLHYVEDTLISMRNDTDPFEYIQINTSIHPSVMFHISDLDESPNRDLIMNMVRDSMWFNAQPTPK
jgi:hypothetical protein